MATTCSKCKGTREVEESEPRSFRRTRLHRFDPPDPPPCGVWRYQALSAVKTPTKPITEGETVAKVESEPITPECAEEKIWPCSPEYWRPCARCQKLICEMHDYRISVWPPESGAFEPADMICRDCVAALWSRGDISQGARVQYIN